LTLDCEICEFFIFFVFKVEQNRRFFSFAKYRS